MVRLVRVRLNDDPAEGVVLFEEVIGTSTGHGPVGRGRVELELNQRLDEALETVRPAAAAVLDAFRGLSPGSVSVEFGLSVDAEAGAFVAKASAEAHFTVTLSWSNI